MRAAASPWHKANATADCCRLQDSAGVDESLSAAADSGDPEAVFKVIEEHGQEFSESNVTNSFAALAKVADGKGLDEGAVHGHRSFQTLVGGIRERACDQSKPSFLTRVAERTSAPARLSLHSRKLCVLP
jgi:hypothetical protein